MLKLNNKIELISKQEVMEILNSVGSPYQKNEAIKKLTSYEIKDEPKKRNVTYAVDFDGTLCKACYPCIGDSNTILINFLKLARKRGDKVILWTCRDGKELEDAVAWCRQYGLIFDAVNANLPEAVEAWGTDPRKVAADVYIDDRAALYMNGVLYAISQNEPML